MAIFMKAMKAMKSMKAMKKAMKAMKATKKGVLKRIKAQHSLSKTIKVDGKTYDKEMILAARRATRGVKNVLISMTDAKQIFEAARPTGTTGQSTYDALEKKTMAHIRKTYKFTPEANLLLRKMIARAAAAQAKRTKAMKATKTTKAAMKSMKAMKVMKAMKAMK
eukprot:TRINITY_DN1910_c1_g1_i1.p1 TRINITY_DN1910_c1_g1~~TRINITY_DN1910_c1_g1_i1.p1  ORF type:complete len:186 (-),score=47.10 TRINITY_DN1910_c1_g1_i1:173-667(-)